MSDERVERGAAEEMSGAPLTDTEARAATRPAGQPDADTAKDSTDVDAADVQEGTADTARTSTSSTARDEIP
ncbi:hypothetical protein [Micromonospora sp. CPCC 206061]|uniref:hypothetical protein n=1 Tax=Micromonospora sp. CPCC 206061 TaxID=3122410 RepID=UPI002FF00A2B